jgi:Holliday junction DNA helicase RuvA
MIGRLKGEVAAIGVETVLIDVGGVGYEVRVSPRTIGAMPALGETFTLLIETYVREDMIRLYGFATEAERAWFRALQNVQGVGAKLALAVLATLAPQDLANAVALKDHAMIARTPGVGPKVAARVVAELKDRMPQLSPAILPGGSNDMPQPVVPPQGSAAVDAVSALSNLGYQQAQAAAAISAAVARAGPNAKAEELIRLGLKELAR